MDEKVLQDFMEGFAGESQANRKYLIYAEQAEKEGYTNVARLFRAAADAETIHAFNEFKAAGKLGNTAANLEDAINGKTYENQVMYPKFAEDAVKANDEKMAKLFNGIGAVEDVHAKLYKEALEAVKSGKDVEGDYYLCPICGYVDKEIPDKCPICGASGSKFKKY